MAKTKGQDGFDLRREHATEGGGIDGALATLTEIEFVEEFTYGGRFRDKPVAALRTVYEIEGQERPWEDHWPLGPSQNFRVVESGDGIVKIGGGSLNKKSAAYFFFDHLISAAEASGLSFDDILPDLDDHNCQSVAELRGRRVRLASRPFENLSGERKDKVVIAAFVDDEPVAKGKSSSKATKKNGADVEEKTVEAIEALLADNDGKLKAADIPTELFKLCRKDPDVKTMMQLALRKEWLFAEDRPWVGNPKKGVIEAVEA